MKLKFLPNHEKECERNLVVCITHLPACHRRVCYHAEPHELDTSCVADCTIAGTSTQCIPVTLYGRGRT
jgi:hypothetical protein